MVLTPLLAAALCAAVLIGFLSTLPGCLRPLLATRFGIMPEEVPHLGRRLHLAWIPLMPATGWMVDAWGVHGILFAGSLVLSFGVAWLAVAQSMRSLTWGLLPLAWGGAALTLTGIRLMPAALDLPSPEGALSVGFLFIALAALLTQAFCSRLIQKAGYRNTLLVSALLCLAPAIIAAFVEPTDFPPAPDDPDPSALLRDARLWLLALLIFFWFPIEHSLDVWPRPFLSELGYPSKAVTSLIVGFWFWFLVTRLAMGFLYLKGHEIWLIYALALIPPMILGNLVGAYAPSSGYFGFWLVGACYGPMLPAFLGITMGLFQMRAFVLGLLLSIDSLCALIVQPAFVSYLRSHTARQAMRVPLIFGLLLAAVLLVLALLRN